MGPVVLVVSGVEACTQTLRDWGVLATKCKQHLIFELIVKNDQISRI